MIVEMASWGSVKRCFRQGSIPCQHPIRPRRENVDLDAKIVQKCAKRTHKDPNFPIREISCIMVLDQSLHTKGGDKDASKIEVSGPLEGSFEREMMHTNLP